MLSGCDIQNQIRMCKILKLPILTLRQKFTLKIKVSVYKSFVRSAMHYGSETWCFCPNENGILQRTERAMVRSIYGVRLVDKN